MDKNYLVVKERVAYYLNIIAGSYLLVNRDLTTEPSDFYQCALLDINISMSATTLGPDRYWLCWFPKVATQDIRPVLHIDKCIDIANSGNAWNQMNMMRINWMVRNLQRYPMYKPIVVDPNWSTVVGDTRLMACDILGIDQVPVLAQLREPQGQVLEDPWELFDILGMDQDKNIVWRPDGSDPRQTVMTWFDISDSVAAKHIVTDDAAAEMIQGYLAQQPSDFQFSRAWCRERIDWLSFSNLSGQSAASLRKIS